MLTSGLPQPPPEGGLLVSHPAFRPHPIQGVSPDFIPKLTADAVAAGYIDQVVPVNGADALRLSRELAQREGLFVGISAGAALAAGLKIAESAPQGATILCMLPDTGERYLSTPLFEDIPVDMTKEEEAIARSTPSCRFDEPATPAQEEPAVAPADADAEADALVAAAVADNAVVMFALEWCEFCWSVRRLFAALSVQYRSVDLDSVAYQQDDLGGRIRAALSRRTGEVTIPQIFIGGDFIGGCGEAFDAAASGDLQKRLRDAGVAFESHEGAEFHKLLPNWLQQKPAS
jgi:cysteine synthase A